MSLALRVKHTVTAYHLRDRLSDKPYSLAMCDCGWTGFLRPSFNTRLRQFACIFLGHEWDEETFSAEAGPLDFEDGQGDWSVAMRQCSRCYRCKDVDA